MHSDATPRANAAGGDPIVPAIQRVDPTRSRRKWLIPALILIAIAFLATVIPSPYIIERPGSVANTLGDVTVNNKPEALIQVADGALEKNTGSLNMLTVNVLGNPDFRVSWAMLVPALLDSTQDLVPFDDYYPSGVSAEEVSKFNASQMTSAQDTAIVAALRQRGENIPVSLVVAEVLSDAPAAKQLKAGDKILAVNGKTVSAVADITAQLAADDNTTATVTSERDGKTQDVDVEFYKDNGKPIFGIMLQTDFDVPQGFKYALEDVGGPSAGAVFALAILDKLDPTDLTGGKQIGVTGTIDVDGNIGAIGGIKQKLWGAKAAGSQLVMFPRENCQDLPAETPAGMQLAAVSNLEEALAVLSAVRAGDPLPKTASCSAK